MAAAKAKRSKAKRPAERAENKIRRSLVQLGEVAEKLNSPHSKVRVVRNKDGSVDGQLVVRGNWNNIETKIIELLAEGGFEVPPGMKIATQVRFGVGKFSEEREDAEIKGYRKAGGLPSINLYHRKSTNFHELIIATSNVGENVLERGYGIRAVAVDLRWEPPKLRERKGR